MNQIYESFEISGHQCCRANLRVSAKPQDIQTGHAIHFPPVEEPDVTRHSTSSRGTRRETHWIHMDSCRFGSKNMDFFRTKVGH